jgi:hypothetical protein
MRNNIKSFKKFNEEMDPEVVKLYWESHLLGTLGYLATFGISYVVFHLINGKSKDLSVSDTKKVINKLRKNDEFKSVLSKVLDNEQIKSLLKEYEHKLDNRTITFNEMKRLAELMKQELGDFLTVNEWSLCDDLIDEILNPSDECYTEKEKEILRGYKFEEKSDKEFINKELNIKILKKLSFDDDIYYEFRKENEEFKKGSFSAIMSQRPEIISDNYTDLKKCIIDSISEPQQMSTGRHSNKK